MRYAVVVHHDEGSDYGVTVPGLPGCFSAGDTFGDALESVVEAIDGHLEVLTDHGGKVPLDGDIDEYARDPDYADGIWAVVDVDVTPYLGNTLNLHVTLPASLVSRIDAKYKNRSKFLTEVAMAALA